MPIARRYESIDPRVRYVHHPQNLGASFNHNFVIEQARGEFFKWVSDDDLYAPDLLERCIDALDSRPEIALAHAWTAFIDDAGRITHARLPTDHRCPRCRRALPESAVHARRRRHLRGHPDVDPPAGGAPWQLTTLPTAPSSQIWRCTVPSTTCPIFSTSGVTIPCGPSGPHPASVDVAPIWTPGVRTVGAILPCGWSRSTCWAYVAAIWRAPIGPTDRWRCGRELAVWVARHADPMRRRRLLDSPDPAVQALGAGSLATRMSTKVRTVVGRVASGR